jgi:hypothetical protein
MSPIDRQSIDVIHDHISRAMRCQPLAWRRQQSARCGPSMVMEPQAGPSIRGGRVLLLLFLIFFTFFVFLFVFFFVFCHNESPPLLVL